MPVNLAPTFLAPNFPAFCDRNGINFFIVPAPNWNSKFNLYGRKRDTRERIPESEIEWVNKLEPPAFI